MGWRWPTAGRLAGAYSDREPSRDPLGVGRFASDRCAMGINRCALSLGRLCCGLLKTAGQPPGMTTQVANGRAFWEDIMTLAIAIATAEAKRSRVRIFVVLMLFL